MKFRDFQHTIVKTTAAGETTIARQVFRRAFSRWAWGWFDDVVRSNTMPGARIRTVNDLTLAGKHYAGENGDTYELR